MDQLAAAEHLWKQGDHDGAWLKIEELAPIDRVMPEVIDLRLRILTGTCRWELGEDLASVLRFAVDEDDEEDDDYLNRYAITSAEYHHTGRGCWKPGGDVDGARERVRWASELWPVLRLEMMDAPALERSLALAEGREIDKAMVHKVSRVARRNSDAHRFLERLTDAKVSLCWYAQKIETLLPSGKPNPAASLMFALLAEIARNERETLRERIMSGLDEARRKGNTLGRPAGTKTPTEEFLRKHADIRRRLGKGLSIRETAAATGKGISTVQRVKAALAEQWKGEGAWLALVEILPMDSVMPQGIDQRLRVRADVGRWDVGDNHFTVLQFADDERTTATEGGREAVADRRGVVSDRSRLEESSRGEDSPRSPTNFQNPHDPTGIFSLGAADRRIFIGFGLVMIPKIFIVKSPKTLETGQGYPTRHVG